MRSGSTARTLTPPMLIVAIAVAAGTALIAALLLYAPELPERDDRR